MFVHQEWRHSAAVGYLMSDSRKFSMSDARPVMGALHLGHLGCRLPATLAWRGSPPLEMVRVTGGAPAGLTQQVPAAALEDLGWWRHLLETHLGAGYTEVGRLPGIQEPWELEGRAARVPE